MDKSLLTHSLVAVAAVGIAFAAWKEPGAMKPDDQVVLIDADPKDLGRISWHEDDWDVSIQRQGDGARIEVTQRKRDKLKPEAAKADDVTPNDGSQPAVEATPPGLTETRRVYPGNKTALTLFEQLAPLKAPRRLGKPEGNALTEFGLDKPSGTLSLVVGSTTHEVRVGAATYGSGDSYAQLSDGDLVLLKATLLSPLKRGASTLLDKRALGLDLEEVERLRIGGNGKSRDLLQRFADAKDKAFFADAGIPDEKLETATPWVDRLVKLRADEVVEEAGAFANAGAPALTIEATDKGGKTFSLSLWAPDAEGKAFAKSSRYELPILIAKANAEALLKDLDALLSEGR